MRGAIVSYGVTDVDVARNAARLVVRVLNGQPAGDMPIEQPTKVELVIDLKAAKALGIRIPDALLGARRRGDSMTASRPRVHPRSPG